MRLAPKCGISAVFVAVLLNCKAGTGWAAPTLTTLVTFNVSNEADPVAGPVADASGCRCGTTDSGGARVLAAI
ncbi:MAG: hypothetical protein ACHRHE_13820 [Tepidisphaerales bacterium]